MRILHFTDLHGNIDGINLISREIEEADILILSGDITHFGHKEEAQQIIDAFYKLNNNLLAVTGNCDHPDVIDYLNETDFNLENSLYSYDEFDFIGLGGSLYTPFNTPNEYNEDYYEEQLNKLKVKLSGKPLIIVSHQPPYNTIIDKIMAVMHVGSKSLRMFIEETHPLVCLCGHIHESIGIDKIGNTQVVNPGTWRSKNYASIIIDENSNVDIKILKA